MAQFTKASPLRVALLLLLGLFVLDYAWVQTHPEGGRGRRGWNFGMMVAGNACPDALEVKPDEQAMLGESEFAWKLTALDGRETTLAEHRGKVVFVNMWATWCGPCIEEMPSIQALYDAAQKEGVAFVLVSEEHAETVKKFVEQEKYTLPIFTTQAVPAKFQSRGIPATFIVSRQGAIVHQHVGMANWNTDACRKFLHALQ